MIDNFHEVELRRVLKADFDSLRIKDVGAATPFFRVLEKFYPVDGSRINWKNIKDSIEKVEENTSIQNQRFVDFFDEIFNKFHLSGSVIYIGDGATDFALIGLISDMRRVLFELLSIPQHHYLIGENYSWCACMTMEGDMGFGFRPSA